MTDLTPEAVKDMMHHHERGRAHNYTGFTWLELNSMGLAREYLRLKEENAILRTEKHADAEAIAHLKEVEKAAQWVVDNPRAHPANMVNVCRAAVEGK